MEGDDLPTTAREDAGAPITPGYCQMMASYNRWQNRSLFTAVDALGEAARRAERGAFFGSIHATLAHVLWADHMWMSRFAGWQAPPAGIADSPRFVAGWAALHAAREAADAAIISWAHALRAQDVQGVMRWHSGALDREVSRPAGLCLVHFFNHQTHHRGQVHALVTSAGGVPDATDLFVMPATATDEV